MRRVTDFRSGDRVCLLRNVEDISGQHGYAGETGTLGRLYRIQEQKEIWEVILDRKYRPLGDALRGGSVNVTVCASHVDVARL